MPKKANPAGTSAKGVISAEQWRHMVSRTRGHHTGAAPVRHRR